MDLNNYTERLRGFIQSAQSYALREQHQRFTPEHILKVILDDPEGLAANLMTAAHADPKAALRDTEVYINKFPKVETSGEGQLYLDPKTAQLFDQAKQVAEKAGVA